MIHLALRHHIRAPEHKVSPATIIAAWVVVPVLLWALILLAFLSVP